MGVDEEVESNEPLAIPFQALVPNGPRESSGHQESEQSSATTVPQLRVAADMTRRWGGLTLKPEDAAGTSNARRHPKALVGRAED